MHLIILAAALSLPIHADAPPVAMQIEVPEPVLATEIVDRQPVGAATAFPADVGHIFFWTRVTGATAGTVIEHVWYRGDEEVARVRLRLGGDDWRTWSRKTIPVDWTGDWQVDVVGPDDEVIESVSFTVG